MYRTFNMGTGIIIAVDKEYADNVCSWLGERMNGVAKIGTVVDNGHKVTHAIEGVEFSHY
jgi:phosphoribosylaminoimidazole (AIR) synthetase